MATWPTISDVRNKYKKLNWNDIENRMAGDVTATKNKIINSLSELYETSGFIDNPPQTLVDLFFPLLYGTSTLLTHVGSNESGSDSTGEKAYKRAEDELNEYASGSRILMDNGVIIPRRSYSSGYAEFARPMMGFLNPDDYGVVRDNTYPKWI